MNNNEQVYILVFTKHAQIIAHSNIRGVEDGFW